MPKGGLLLHLEHASIHVREKRPAIHDLSFELSVGKQYGQLCHGCYATF